MAAALVWKNTNVVINESCYCSSSSPFARLLITVVNKESSTVFIFLLKFAILFIYDDVLSYVYVMHHMTRSRANKQMTERRQEIRLKIIFLSLTRDLLLEISKKTFCQPKVLLVRIIYYDSDHHKSQHIIILWMSGSIPGTILTCRSCLTMALTIIISPCC